MSRRHDGLSSLLSVMARDLKKAVMGKITWYSAGYKFSDQPWTNEGGYTHKPFLDQSGHMIVLTPGRHVRCPQAPIDAPKPDKTYSVKMNVCMKCPHHLPKMCCALLRDQGKSAPSEMRQLIQTAAEEANNMVNR